MKKNEKDWKSTEKCECKQPGLIHITCKGTSACTKHETLLLNLTTSIEFKIWNIYNILYLKNISQKKDLMNPHTQMVPFTSASPKWHSKSKSASHPSIKKGATSKFTTSVHTHKLRSWAAFSQGVHRGMQAFEFESAIPKADLRRWSNGAQRLEWILELKTWKSKYSIPNILKYP